MGVNAGVGVREDGGGGGSTREEFHNLLLSMYKSEVNGTIIEMDSVLLSNVCSRPCLH